MQSRHFSATMRTSIPFVYVTIILLFYQFFIIYKISCLFKFKYHPSGGGFATASEDKTARLWDLRSDQQLGQYKPPNSNPGFTSCALSLSGRYIFCGSDDNFIHIWDSLKTTYNGKKILYKKICRCNIIFCFKMFCILHFRSLVRP